MQLSFGAIFGLGTIESTNSDFARTWEGTLRLTRVRLDRDGYDVDGGRYFGRGAPVFLVEGDGVSERWGGPMEEDVYIFLRAGDRAAARAQIQRAFPRAKVGR